MFPSCGTSPAEWVDWADINRTVYSPVSMAAETVDCRDLRVLPAMFFAAAGGPFLARRGRSLILGRGIIWSRLLSQVATATPFFSQDNT